MKVSVSQMPGGTFFWSDDKLYLKLMRPPGKSLSYVELATGRLTKLLADELVMGEVAGPALGVVETIRALVEKDKP